MKRYSRLQSNFGFGYVEILIVTQQAANVLRLKRGDLISNNKKQYVYVLGQDKAVRRRIETGLSDMEYIEVLSGLQEGERVIISASTTFRHMKEINIKWLMATYV